MALYYLDGNAVQLKAIDFTSMPELLSASSQAFLGYSPMKELAVVSKKCRRFLYIVLTAHRWDTLPVMLCGVCGWLTSRRHGYLSCDNQAASIDRCCCNFDQYFCDRCIRIQGDEALCLYCLHWESHTGISNGDRLFLQAWTFSLDLRDAILGYGYHSSGPGMCVGPNSPVYPFSASEVIPYNVNGHLSVYYDHPDEG